MAAIRFLALLSTGFVLLALVFLLHASQSRVEREGTRVLRGENLELAAGAAISWELDLNGQRIDQAWPGVQRQPRLVLRGAAPGAVLEVSGRYQREDGSMLADAFMESEGPQRVTLGEAEESDAGALWLSYDHPLRLEVRCVEPGAGGTVTPILRGDPGDDFRAARAISRTVWMVFVAIGAASFALLLATNRDLLRTPGA